VTPSGSHSEDLEVGAILGRSLVAERAVGNDHADEPHKFLGRNFYSGNGFGIFYGVRDEKPLGLEVGVQKSLSLELCLERGIEGAGLMPEIENGLGIGGGERTDLQVHGRRGLGKEWREGKRRKGLIGRPPEGRRR
jgi:hypothetical protein